MNNVEEKKNINKKVKKKNKRIVYIALMLIVFYVIYTIYLLTVEQNKVFTVEQGKLYVEETTTGYIIRDETVIKGENYKNGMKQIKAEGERVAANESVFRYYSQNEESLKQKISELDEKIQLAMQETTNLLTSDVKILENQIDEKIKEINKMKDTSKINEYKKEISEMVSKKAKIAGEASPKGSYLKQLIQERATYESKLNSGAEYIKASKAGIVSYRVDGLEDVLTLANMEALSEEFLSNLGLKTGKIIATSNECGKIIDNFSCYIATISSSKQSKEAKVGDKVKIRLPNNVEIDSEVTHIKQEDDNKNLIVLKVNKEVSELINYRKISFDLIWLSYSGLKVPNQAIVEKDGLKYVVRNRAGYLNKILVKVATVNKKEVVNDKYTIIENYDIDELRELGYTDKQINSYKKISIYDEIVMNPDMDKVQ